MRKIIESTFVTIDGVIGEPHLWGGPYWDSEHSGYASDLLFDADALLLGRETYEGFAQVWPTRPEDDDPYTARINAMPKYVASRTLTQADLTWNATLLEGDTTEAVRTLKSQEGGNILKFGTGPLSHTLLDAKLVDEYHFWVFPALAGRGDRLFDTYPAITHLTLLGTTTFKSGIVVHRLAPH
ncbi:dihydrofolate reductase family protein [Nocardia sp. 2]|uniref:Dihydrofolate reductase family protein n=1 Tax=Nocardia acididurans TaxID=2802282 RepID=A0ABS1MCX2_9NOCA|nr:dihydrofolate reductase family protein [Nocardia acididurans]MBL1078467.1 dihydrofolate reductase family protein [Nocardia acididurans]